MLPTPLRILLVDSSDVEADRLLDGLRQAGFAPSSVRVETEEEFLARLGVEWDVIFADHDLPPIDSLTALNHIAARRLNVPLIVVSGTNDPEALDRVLRAGAADVVERSGLDRLEEKVRQAIAQRLARIEERLASVSREASEDRLRLALTAADAATWELDLQTGGMTGSDRLAELLGLTPGTAWFTYTDALAKVHPDDRDHLISLARKTAIDGVTYEVENRVMMPDGSTRWIEEHGELVERDEDGRGVRMIGIMKDVTSRKESEQHLRESEARFRAMVQHSSDLIVIIDADGKWKYVSPVVKEIIGYEAHELVGRDSTEFHHPDEIDETKRFLSDLAQQPGAVGAAELRVQRRDGSWAWLQITATNLLEDPAVEGIVVNSRDVTHRRALEDLLRHQAFHDVLTGLPNRALVLDRLTQAVRRARRNETRVVVLFIDLDNFKLINDSLGHSSGDELLKAMAIRIQLGMREGDTVARLGGDEFVCVLEDVLNAHIAQDAALRVQERIQAPIVISGKTISISASIGLAISSTPVEPADALLQFADKAMYAAKRAGTNRISTYVSSLTDNSWDRLDVEADMRQALRLKEFHLEYQPIVSLRSGGIEAVEALVRWHHPTRGLVSPLDFIPISELTDLILPLGGWVIAEACREASTWPERADHGAPIVSVNISARQVTPALICVVTAALVESGLPPGGLMLEITERVALTDDMETRSTLLALHEMGVLLAVDDFGTGFSGLGSIRDASVATLKIDRSFVAGLGQDQRDTGIVKAVIAMADVLGLQTIAEGVETAAQAEQLKELGCDWAQGYYFDRPLPPLAIQARLGQSRIATLPFQTSATG